MLKNSACFLNLLLLCLLLSVDLYAQNLEFDEEDYLLASEYRKPIVEQEDFYERFHPETMLLKNRTSERETRVNPHFDISQFSDELIKESGVPILASAPRYHVPVIPIDFSRLFPSVSGPTGMIDSISARALPRGKTSVAWLQANSKADRSRLFRNVNSYKATDTFLAINHSIADNIELMTKINKTVRDTTTSIGTRFHSAEYKFPEYSLGIKLHQKVGDNEFALGIINTTVEAASRNLILDQDFEHFKTVYFTMTSPLTYRTESNFTIKRSSTDNKFANNNSWYSAVFGLDTKVTASTHILGELKYEDYQAQSDKFIFNGAVRHVVGKDMGIDVYSRRLAQKGYAETGFRLSGAF